MVWWLALVWFVAPDTTKYSRVVDAFLWNDTSCLVSFRYIYFLPLTFASLGSVMPVRQHTMPDSDEEVQRDVEKVFGFKPCLWQIQVVRAILAGKDVITIAPTGSGKSLTYWMPLLYIKHGITVVVSRLKLLGTQFIEMLGDNGISKDQIMIHFARRVYSARPSAIGGSFRLLDYCFGCCPRMLWIAFHHMQALYYSKTTAEIDSTCCTTALRLRLNMVWSLRSKMYCGSDR
jgi:hypothetical protein